MVQFTWHKHVYRRTSAKWKKNDSISSSENHPFYNVSFFYKKKKNTDVLLLPKSQANNQKNILFYFYNI